MINFPQELNPRDVYPFQSNFMESCAKRWLLSTWSGKSWPEERLKSPLQNQKINLSLHMHLTLWYKKFALLCS